MTDIPALLRELARQYNLDKEDEEWNKANAPGANDKRCHVCQGAGGWMYRPPSATEATWWPCQECNPQQ